MQCNCAFAALCPAAVNAVSAVTLASAVSQWHCSAKFGRSTRPMFSRNTKLGSLGRFYQLSDKEFARKVLDIFFVFCLY
jgi:hypothetical protein